MPRNRLALFFQLINQLNRILGFNVEIVVFYDAILTDDNGPRGATGFESTHNSRPLFFATTVADRNSGELVFLGNSEGFFGCVGAESFEDGLNGDALHGFIVFKMRTDFLQRGETGTVAAGTPGLEAVEVDDFSFERFRRRGFGAWR